MFLFSGYNFQSMQKTRRRPAYRSFVQINECFLSSHQFRQNVVTPTQGAQTNCPVQRDFFPRPSKLDKKSRRRD